MEPTTTTLLTLFIKNKKPHSHSVHKLNGLSLPELSHTIIVFGLLQMQQYSLFCTRKLFLCHVVCVVYLTKWIRCSLNNNKN